METFVVQFEGRYYGTFATETLASAWSKANVGGAPVLPVLPVNQFIQPFPPDQAKG